MHKRGGPIETTRFARSAVCKFCSATVFIDPDAVERSRFRETFALWNDPKTHGFAADACATVGGRIWALRQRLPPPSA